MKFNSLVVMISSLCILSGCKTNNQKNEEDENSESVTIDFIDKYVVWNHKGYKERVSDTVYQIMISNYSSGTISVCINDKFFLTPSYAVTFNSGENAIGSSDNVSQSSLDVESGTNCFFFLKIPSDIKDFMLTDTTILSVEYWQGKHLKGAITQPLKYYSGQFRHVEPSFVIKQYIKEREEMEDKLFNDNPQQ